VSILRWVTQWSCSLLSYWQLHNNLIHSWHIALYKCVLVDWLIDQDGPKTSVKLFNLQAFALNFQKCYEKSLGMLCTCLKTEMTNHQHTGSKISLNTCTHTYKQKTANYNDIIAQSVTVIIIISITTIVMTRNKQIWVNG